MKRAGNQLVAIFVFLSFLGCHENPGKISSNGPRSKQDILMDSLQVLDSLVMKYKAKNADESLKYAKIADNIAWELNTPEARAKAYITLGNAHAVITIDSGLFFHRKALAVIDSFDLTDKKGQVLYNLGMLYRKVNNYEKCITFIDSALWYSVSVNDFKTMSNALNALGGWYLNIGEKVKARQLFDSAFAVAQRESLYLQMGSALGNLARFETDSKKSIRMQRRAISYLEKGSGSDEPIALSLTNIGYRLPDPDSAIYYFNRAINMVSLEFSPEVIIGAYNNMAYCYLAKDDVNNAEKCILEHALPVAVKTNNIDWQSTVYDTYADILHLKGKSNDAMVYKNKAKDAKREFKGSVSAILHSAGNH
ncbi:MAG: tetratricopeptide repeat protein [Bacteroidales bacterium]|nr:tetratricopeptide repeat protein [Bacteroidales bacterium]